LRDFAVEADAHRTGVHVAAADDQQSCGRAIVPRPEFSP
jgi:hypothetical protein